MKHDQISGPDNAGCLAATWFERRAERLWFVHFVR